MKNRTTLLHVILTSLLSANAAIAELLPIHSTRFESSSNAIYTFHCDGAASYLDGSILKNLGTTQAEIKLIITFWDQDSNWSYDRKGYAELRPNGTIVYNDENNDSHSDENQLKLILSEDTSKMSILTFNSQEFNLRCGFKL